MATRNDKPELTTVEFAGAHRVIAIVAGIAVVWILVECALMLPALIARYGWH